MSVVYRSAVSGRYVTRRYAEAHPDSTVSEDVGRARAALARIRLALRPKAGR